MFKKHKNYKQLKDHYAYLIGNREGSEILNTIDRIWIYNQPIGDMGAKILGLGLLKNARLMYLELSIFLRE